MGVTDKTNEPDLKHLSAEYNFFLDFDWSILLYVYDWWGRVNEIKSADVGQKIRTNKKEREANCKLLYFEDTLATLSPTAP